MARKATKQAGPTPVDAITHGDKRTNIPTADAHDFVDPEIEAVRTVRYPRDPTSTRSSSGEGKDDARTASDLVADAPPIYIQEKIDPRVLIENLRRTAARPEDEPELTLFESFDGLGELDLVEFYKHDANWSNRMILGDSLQVMASARRARGAARQGPDDLHRPAVRHQVRLQLAGRRPASATSRTASSRTPPARPSRSRRSATPGSSASTRT